MANISKYPLLSYHPLRFLYRLAAAASIVARLPFWLVISLVPPLRPNRKWSPIQTLMARLLRASLHTDSVIGIGEADTQSLTPPKGEGDRFVVLQPFDAQLYTGPLASDPSVSPAPVSCTWRPGPPPPRSAHEAATSSSSSLKKVVLHIHGGAFVRDHPATSATGFLSSTLLAHAGVDAVLSLSYRLSGHGGRNPFPAALQDALTAYLYLVREVGLAPSAVTVSGDSAGGNMVVALLRYLDEFGPRVGVEPPARAVLIAPWVAPPACFPRRAAGELRVEQMANYNSDILPASFLQWGIKTYAPGGDVEAARENPYIQALGHPFRAGVPVLVSVGEAEIFSTDVAVWAREMSGYEGGGVNKVEVYVEENAPHDTLLIGDALKWGDSAKRVAARIGEFIDKN
ncbi:alpha/beta hydrolase fold-3 domain-containing protein [Diaporthe helianthi]|uniref:Alpha/beta hydrolase fold-3 domain-containing protein n=1 Tax=Diaporthe helianthi TaxID=158607 RepID=A0A2P5IG92_DIAHE|nr:alpha/beta hydrolase fold-3 domain-containing protein [Diaporthe helianthi]